MEINILIINEIANHNASSKSHFSLTKGENVAKNMAAGNIDKSSWAYRNIVEPFQSMAKKTGKEWDSLTK